MRRTTISRPSGSCGPRSEVATERSSPHVLLTDGDLVGSDAGWLDEELTILGRYLDVFGCGVSLDMGNVPVEAFPAAVNWVPPPVAVHDDYVEGLTGIHLVLYRAAGMAGFLNYQRRNRLRFVDSMMHRYAYDQLGQRWARTKVATARHLTWDLYAQPDHPYARMKASKTLDEHWRHERYCGFTALGHDGRQRHHDPTPD